MKDSLQLTITIDSTSIATQNLNNQFNTKTERVIGSGLVALVIIGFIYTRFIFKRPNQ